MPDDDDDHAVISTATSYNPTDTSHCPAGCAAGETEAPRRE